MNIEEIVSSEEMPEVQPHAIEAIKADNAAKLAEYKAEGFDPEQHQTDAQGLPVLTKGGKFAKKRGAKKGKVKSVLNLSDKKQEKESADPQASDSLQAAAVTSDILENLQCVLISDEFRYSDIEREGNIEAWRGLYDHYGGVKVHPAMAVSMSHVAIILDRARKEKTKTKFALAKAWFLNKILRKKENARVNNRKDIERENNLREKESGSAQEKGD